jgi:hypothetical protein
MVRDIFSFDAGYIAVRMNSEIVGISFASFCINIACENTFKT